MTHPSLHLGQRYFELENGSNHPLYILRLIGLSPTHICDPGKHANKLAAGYEIRLKASKTIGNSHLFSRNTGFSSNLRLRFAPWRSHSLVKVTIAMDNHNI